MPDEHGKVDCAAIPRGSPTVAGAPLGPLEFPTASCSPRDSGSGAWTCCSDDPSAVGGALPAYGGKNIDGAAPLFAEHNNDVGIWGMCVRTGDIPDGAGLENPASCPLPCDPTWDPADVRAVCGAGRVCCQTAELEPEDCILDPQTKLWRPVRADDIGDATQWAEGSHATHQDPGGTGCAAVSGGHSTEAWQDCVGQLRVADQRGYCMALHNESCPDQDPSYVDACTQINMGLMPPPS